MKAKQQNQWVLTLVAGSNTEITIRPSNPTKPNSTLVFWDYEDQNIRVKVHFSSGNSNPPKQIRLLEYGPRRKALGQSPDEPLAIAGTLVNPYDVVRTLFTDDSSPPSYYLICSCPHGTPQHKYEDGYDDCRKSFLRDVDHYEIQ